MSHNNPNSSNNTGNLAGGSGTGATQTEVSRGTSGAQNLERANRPGQSAGSTSGAGTATALAQEYGQKISEVANTAKEYVSDKVSEVGDKIKDLQNMDINDMANQAKDFARKNPGQTILISAAAGLVLGLLLRGSRR